MTGEPNDGERQRLLDSVLAGERSLADPQVQSAMRADDRFAREVEGLQQLQARLSQRALEVQQDLDHREPGLEAAVETMVLRRGRERPRSVRRWLPWLLAAAVLVVAWLAWPDGPKTPQHLGDLSVVPTADGRGLQFQLRRPTQGYFVVKVLDRDGKLAFPVIQVETSTWVPDARQVADWPQGGRVEVEAFQADQQLLFAAPPILWSPSR